MSDVPRLGRGRHARRGGPLCVMELSSGLAGETHSDRPAAVHPLLAAVARVANDSVSDQARACLVPLAGQLIGTADDDPRVADRIVLVACERALAAGALPVWVPRLRRAERVARRHLSTEVPRPRSWWRVRRQETTVTLAAASMAFGPLADHDAELISLLTACLAAARSSRPEDGTGASPTTQVDAPDPRRGGLARPMSAQDQHCQDEEDRRADRHGEAQERR